MESSLQAQITAIINQHSRSQAEDLKDFGRKLQQFTYQPTNNSNFQQFLARKDTQLRHEVTRQIAEVDHIASTIQGAIAAQLKKGVPREKAIENGVKDSISYLVDKNPFLQPLLTKTVKQEIITVAQTHFANSQAQTVNFQKDLKNELDQHWADIFPDANTRAQIAREIYEEISLLEHTDPGRLPHEIIRAKLNQLALIAQAGSQTLDVEALNTRAEDLALKMGNAGFSIQEEARFQTLSDRDGFKINNPNPFYILGQARAPRVYTNALTGYLGRRSLKNLFNEVDLLDEELIHKLIPDENLSLAVKKSQIKTHVSKGWQYYQAGVDEKWLRGFTRHVDNIPQTFKGVNPKHDQYIAQVRQLTESRRIFEAVKSHNPQAINRVNRLTSGWNTAKRLPGKLDVFGLRYKLPYINMTIRRRYNDFTRPLDAIFSPYVYLNNLIYKYNPNYYVRKQVHRGVMYVRRAVGNRLMRLSHRLLTKAAGKKLTLLAGKVVGKAALAVGGLSTGGIGTLAAIAWILKDIFDLLGGTDALKRSLKITTAISLGLTVVGAKIATSIFTPILLALKALWTGLVTLATSFLNFIQAIGVYIATFFTTSASTALATGAVVSTVMIPITGGVLDQAVRSEVFTLPVIPEGQGPGEVPEECSSNSLEPIPQPEAVGVVYSSDGKYAFPVARYQTREVFYVWCDHWNGKKAVDMDPYADRELLVAYTSGTVASTHYGDAGGKNITIKGNDGKYYYYAHLCNFAVSRGDTVTAGQVIGTTDNTGNSTAEHLHFSIGTNTADLWDDGAGDICPQEDFERKFNLGICDPNDTCRTDSRYVD